MVMNCGKCYWLTVLEMIDFLIFFTAPVAAPVELVTNINQIHVSNPFEYNTVISQVTVFAYIFLIVKVCRCRLFLMGKGWNLQIKISMNTYSKIGHQI